MIPIFCSVGISRTRLLFAMLVIKKFVLSYMLFLGSGFTVESNNSIREILVIRNTEACTSTDTLPTCPGCLKACALQVRYLPWPVLIWAENGSRTMPTFLPIRAIFCPNQDSQTQLFHLKSTSIQAAQANVSDDVQPSVGPRHSCTEFFSDSNCVIFYD